MADLKDVRKGATGAAETVAGTVGDLAKGVTENLEGLTRDIGREVKRVRPGERRDPRNLVLLLALAVLAIVVLVVGGSRAAGAQDDDELDWT
ncbi:MAG: hypothetical protein H0X16_10405 [Chloroflexi bacterium]|nr:hypothetical protein [Chloroflexota bacterium]